MSETKLMALDQFRSQMAHKNIQQQLLNYFGGDEGVVRKFLSAVTHSVRKTPKLLECDKTSLMEAFITCAEFKLYPSAASGEAFVLPYGSKNGLKAQFQLGYQGIITLLYRAGVESVTSKIVYKNDIFEYEEGLDSKLIHKPDIFSSDRGPAIAVYAIGIVNGQKLFHVMTRDEVMKFRDFSKSKGSDYSPWNANDPELWMWRKTCIKQLAKTLPKNETIAEAISKDNLDSKVSDLAERRSISAAELKKDAPTMKTLTKGKDDKKTKTPQAEDLFGVAGNHSETSEGEK